MIRDDERSETPKLVTLGGIMVILQRMTNCEDAVYRWKLKEVEDPEVT